MLKNFFLALSALLFSSISLAQTGSYAFTGTVTAATGTFSSITTGTSISGTFYVNYNNAMPFVSIGNPGSTSGWDSEEVTGSNVGTASSSNFVFSSAITVNSTNYSTTAGTYLSSSFVKFFTEGNYNILEAAEDQITNSVSSGSSFTLSTNGTSNVDTQTVTPLPFTSGGLPAFPSGTTGTGYFTTGSGNTVYFTLATF